MPGIELIRHLEVDAQCQLQQRGLRVLFNCPNVASNWVLLPAVAKVAVLLRELNSAWLNVLYVSRRNCTTILFSIGMFWVTRTKVHRSGPSIGCAKLKSLGDSPSQPLAVSCSSTEVEILHVDSSEAWIWTEEVIRQNAASGLGLVHKNSALSLPQIARDEPFFITLRSFAFVRNMTQPSVFDRCSVSSEWTL